MQTNNLETAFYPAYGFDISPIILKDVASIEHITSGLYYTEVYNGVSYNFDGAKIVFKNNSYRLLNTIDFDGFLEKYIRFQQWLIEELANQLNNEKLIPNYQQAPTFFAFSSNSRVDLQNINTVLPSQKKIIFENGSNFVSGGNDDEFEKFLIAYDKFKESERQRIEIETNCKIQNSFAYPKA